MEYEQRRKLVVIGVLLTAIVVVILGFTIYNVIRYRGTIAVSIAVLPKDSSLSVDGRPIHNTTAHVKPGAHTFAAKKDGFDQDTQTLSIDSDHHDVALLPTPVSDAAKQWANRSSISQQREDLGGQEANQRGDSLGRNYPIINKLPYSSIAGPFSIDYGYTGENNTKIYLLIHDSTPNGRQAALAWLKSQGVDPTKLDIRFPDFVNQLTWEGEGE